MKLKTAFIFIMCFEFCAWLVWYFNETQWVVFIGLSVLSAALIFRNHDYTLILFGVDLLIDPMGRMLSIGFFSFRMVLFLSICAVVISKLFHEQQYRTRCKTWLQSRLGIAWMTLGCVMLVGLVIGIMSGIPFTAVYHDMNGYFLFILVPYFSLYAPREMQKIITWLYGAWLFLATKTMILFVWFSHVSHPFFDSAWYHYFRDTRFVEITPLDGQGVRIFSQSMIYAFLVVFVVSHMRSSGYSMGLSRSQYKLIMLTGMIMMLMSLSRSMWLALFVSLLCMVVYDLYIKKKIQISAIKHMMIYGLSSLVALFVLFIMPIAKNGTPADFARMFINRAELQTEFAAISRWNMLPVLQEAIKQQPLLGYGFGHSLSFESPGNEKITRIQVEWGWHDMAIKLGLIGASIMVWFLYETARSLRGFLWRESLVMSIVLLAIVHMFTPYLNHPLGIGWLLFVLMFSSSQLFVHKQG